MPSSASQGSLPMSKQLLASTADSYQASYFPNLIQITGIISIKKNDLQYH
jgi:hypothetical protein